MDQTRENTETHQDTVNASDFQQPQWNWIKRTAIEMAVSGFIGLLVSFLLSVEAWELSAESSKRFICDINAVLSCSTVAMTPQARILGFPNAFLGICFEAIVLSVSIAILGRTRFPRWYMIGVEAIYTIALLFALWLFFQSVFIIQVMCPWCLVITVTTILVWAGLTRLNLRTGVIPCTQGIKRLLDSGTDWWITGLVLFLLFALVVVKYLPRLL